MQSVIQYRRFRTALQTQLERDKTKIQKPNDASQEASDVQSPDSSTSGESKADERKIDLESGRNDELPSATGRRDFTEPVEEKPQEEVDDEEDDDDDEGDFELMQSRRTLSRSTTQQSAGTKLGHVMTGIEIRKRTTREGGSGNVFVVGYEGDDDPLNPHNWSNFTRIRCTVTIAMIGAVVGFASAIDSSAIKEAAAEFGVSEIVESLATGLYLAGFGTGALIAGPFSETFGRNPVYIVTLGLFMIFIMASGLAPNIGAQLVFRFLAGVFGSTPLTCAGGSISDLWSPLERVFMFPVFANAAFTGPLLGPLLGGWITESSVSWRWVEWTSLIFGGLVLIVVVLFQPETFPPTLLKWKAEHLRALTGDQRYKGSLEVREETLWHKVKRALYRPFLLTFREPIIILIAFYLTIIYIVLFGFLDGFEYIFAEMYDLSPGITGLCFIPIITGLFGASALVPVIYKWAKADLQKIKEKGGDRLPPEFRLWFSMLGGAFAIPISLFWMGWTARPDISIWSPLASAALFGYGILCVFITCYQYIIDAYEIYAASALASVTLIRYVASGGMTVAAIPWFGNLGVPYTLSILGGISALMVPVPYIFFKWGHVIRAKSKYAITTEYN